MSYQTITPENASLFVGRKVRFNYGAMCGSDDGVVTGFETTQWGTHLTAKTDDGQSKTINGFTDIGIGVYLLGEAA